MRFRVTPLTRLGAERCVLVISATKCPQLPLTSNRTTRRVLGGSVSATEILVSGEAEILLARILTELRSPLTAATMLKTLTELARASGPVITQPVGAET